MKKGIWVSVIAGAAAVAAAAVAVGAFLKRKSEALSDHLDYDPEEYFEADDELNGDSAEEEAVGEEAPEEEEEPVSCCCECESEEGSADCESSAYSEADTEEAGADEDKAPEEE